MHRFKTLRVSLWNTTSRITHSIVLGILYMTDTLCVCNRFGYLLINAPDKQMAIHIINRKMSETLL